MDQTFPVIDKLMDEVLTERQSQIVRMYFLDRMTEREIAAELGLSQRHRSQVGNLKERIKSLEEDLDELKRNHEVEVLGIGIELKAAREEIASSQAQPQIESGGLWNDYRPAVYGRGELMCLEAPPRFVFARSFDPVSASEHSHGLQDKDFRWAVKDCEERGLQGGDHEQGQYIYKIPAGHGDYMYQIARTPRHYDGDTVSRIYFERAP